MFEGVAAALAATALMPGLAFSLLWFPAVRTVILGALFYLGLTQLTYVLPIILAFLAFGRRKAAIGVLIPAALVFLLNAACWGMVVTRR